MLLALDLYGSPLLATAKSQFDDQHDITGLFRFDGYFGFSPDGIAEVDKILPVIAMLAFKLSLDFDTFVIDINSPPYRFRFTPPILSFGNRPTVEGRLLHIQSIFHIGTVGAMYHVGGSRNLAKHSRFQCGSKGRIMEPYVEMSIRFCPGALSIDFCRDRLGHSKRPECLI